jgi:hypothetical protein
LHGLWTLLRAIIDAPACRSLQHYHEKVATDLQRLGDEVEVHDMQLQHP